jgi:iron(III) transport system ATP-binding protein
MPTALGGTRRAPRSFAAVSANTLLQLQNVSFAYGTQPVVQGVHLELAREEVLVIVGASGSGKTTFLPPEHRPIGMVFQGLALFPHLTVAGNLAFGLHQLSRAERRQRIADELRSVGLEGLEERFPHQLSGGQQQRVAIARSLVRRPQVLLMDEPFSDLDAHTRQQVRTEVLRILRAHGTAAIIVSHDREDAFHLGDRIAEMDAGRIVRSGPAADFKQAWTAHPFAP